MAIIKDEEEWRGMKKGRNLSENPIFDVKRHKICKTGHRKG